MSSKRPSANEATRSEQEATVEASYKKLLYVFNDYKRRARKMGDEWTCNEFRMIVGTS
ncbi:hypothetical protein E8E11_003718 [Didymella keratinophila]|nr:hypothetical protein E8E11_003718 [Didymella keratinophila]